MNTMKQNGWIELICGCMFSGKSEELIRRVHRAQYGKLKVQTFKPVIDNRYSEAEVVSHNGIAVMAHPVEHSAEMTENISEDTDVVAIDEVQFFDTAVVQVADQLADQGICVIAAGLDQDFRGQPFGGVPEIMAMSETVTKLQAVCVGCGSPANRTQRLIDGEPAGYHDPVIKVGATEAYEARCRHCHQVPGKAKYKAVHTLENSSL